MINPSTPTATPIPLSLYVHIPWCIRKCPYCDFNSHAANINNIPQQFYINTLLQELDQKIATLTALKDRSIQTIFFGGGTPSLLEPEIISYFLKNLSQRLPIPADCEITLEANPGTLEKEHFSGFRAAGINRLSLGIQSLNDAHLTRLGRIHNAQHALAAIAEARNIFENFNVDLMYGLPQQTLPEALSDLQQVIALNPTHLSWYQLTLEPHTAFYRHPPPLPNDDLIWDMQQAGQALLAQQQYRIYEISAYSRESQHQCRHNLNYWRMGDYLGIGAGAHSKLTDTQEQPHRVWRQWNVKHPKDYLNPDKAFTAEKTVVAPSELPLEFMLNVMRLHQPIPFAWWTQSTGLPIEHLAPGLTQAVEKQFVETHKENFQVTALGHRYLNDVLALF